MPSTNDYRTVVNYDRRAQLTPGTFSLAAVDAGWCARATATLAKKPASVCVNFQTVTTAGTCQLRIEPIDSAGKPTGALYDPNAVKTFTPVVGWNVVSFSPVPTTAFVPGTQYGFTLVTLTAGTAHLLRSTVNLGTYPTCVLTTSTASTRSSFVEAAQPCPIMSVIYDDGTEDALQCCQYGTQSNWNVFGTTGYGAKFTLDEPVTADGLDAFMIKTGSPAGDLRLRVLDSANLLYGNATVTVGAGSLSALSASVNCCFGFAETTFPAGTYRAIFDSLLSTSSANCWRPRSGSARVSQLCPSSYILTTAPDVTIASPVWSDSPTEYMAMGLRVVSRSPGGTGGISLARAWQ